MHVSLSELEGTLTKAVKGAGLPFGIGEEAARAVRHAALEEIDCLEAFVAALDALDDGRAGAVELNEPVNGTLLPRAGRVLSSLLAGPAACDILSLRAAMGQTEPGIALARVDVPLVVLVETLALAAEKNADLLIGWHSAEGKPTTVSYPTGPVVHKAGKNWEAPPSGPLDIWVSLRLPEVGPGSNRRTAASHKRLRATQGLTVDDGIWLRLMAYADRMLVENTETSRLTGAGAGVVDRD